MKGLRYLLCSWARVTLMLEPDSIDFKKLDFHAGLEVHHQIRSDRKLFCNCPTTMEKDSKNMDYSFYRYFRPVLGEMGDFDPGMLVEFEKGYKVIYYACERNTCTYEMDETPPFFPDIEAIKKGYVLAFYFNCSALAEEIVVNRKQYLDGSITTGFQRTFIVGRDGWVTVGSKKVRITNVHIEEDAARRVDWKETQNRTVYFNLDRLGIPLTEVITDHRDVEDPIQLVELAKEIGRVLRVSRIGRRGIGVVRQDVNLSIKGGNRVEIKGVQDLGMFDLLCRHEVIRQHTLLEIRGEMVRRGIKKEDFEHMYVDVSHLFKLPKGDRAFASLFPGFRGLFGIEVQPNKDFGEEIFEKSMLITGIAREDHFHSDEIYERSVRRRSDHPCRLDIDKEKCVKISDILRSRSQDAFIVVVGPERRAMHAMKKIVERAKIALDGVPQETRRLLLNGNSEFLRVIHGKERIYPDTDTPPITMRKEVIEECRKKVGDRPWEIYEQLHDRYGLSRDQIDLLIRERKIEKYRSYTENLGLKDTAAYRILIETPRHALRKGLRITGSSIDFIAQEIADKKLTLNQVDSALKALEKNPKCSLEEAVRSIESTPPNVEELRRLIVEDLDNFDVSMIFLNRPYRDRALTKIVGDVLKRLNHSVEGKNVFDMAQTIITEMKRSAKQ